MSSTKGQQQGERPTPTLQVRVWFAGQVVAEAEIRGGLSAMKGAK